MTGDMAWAGEIVSNRQPTIVVAEIGAVQTVGEPAGAFIDILPNL